MLVPRDVLSMAGLTRGNKKIMNDCGIIICRIQEQCYAFACISGHYMVSMKFDCESLTDDFPVTKINTEKIKDFTCFIQLETCKQIENFLKSVSKKEKYNQNGNFFFIEETTYNCYVFSLQENIQIKIMPEPDNYPSGKTLFDYEREKEKTKETKHDYVCINPSYVSEVCGLIANTPNLKPMKIKTYGKESHIKIEAEGYGNIQLVKALILPIA